MDTPEREARFELYKGEGWEAEYSEYRREWTELPQRQEVRGYPLLVDLELSSICNLKCPMCYTITEEFKENVNTTFMDWDLYCKIVDEIGGQVPALRLSLRGEALLHRRFGDCIRYAKSKGIKEVSTLTNGAKLTLPFFEEIVDAGIDWITISADGIGETYERIRKPIKFNDLLNKIKAMNQFKKERSLHRPVIKVQGIWPAIRDQAQEYYDTFAPHVDLVAYNPLIDYLGNDTLIEYLEDFTCPQQYQRLVIGADGLVMKCSNDEENREVIGDANKQTIHELWHSKEMNAVRELHKRDLGFMDSAVCQRCYLPRKTEDEYAEVHGRRFTVKNYVSRNQEIGK
jgi:radical SAM protein with 4Fe4S-binding SPASM domain